MDEAQADEALLTLFVRHTSHTSASLAIRENADPDDMPAHIKAALLPVSLTIPIISGRMMLGTWQGIYLFEHRAHSQRREVAAVVR